MSVAANIKLAHAYFAVYSASVINSAVTNQWLGSYSIRGWQPPVSIHYNISIYSGSGVLDIFITPGRIETASDLNTTFMELDNPYIIHLNGGPLTITGVIENIPTIFDYYIYYNATPGSSGMAIDINIAFMEEA